MEFRRAADERSTATTWVDRNLPGCPFCRSSPPLWETATEVGSTGLTRWHFRCGRCGGIVSIPSETVVSAVGPRMVVGRALFDYIRIESVGRSNRAEGLVGVEYSLTDLRDWAASGKKEEEQH